MNDLMTKSFLNYVDLKKQAMKDVQSEPDVEMGKLDPVDEKDLSKFFEEVEAIKVDLEGVTNLLHNLQSLNEETKSAQSSKILRGLRDQIDADMVSVLRKAKMIKTRLELLNKPNGEDLNIRKGTHIARTRTAVTNGLRVKLKELMNDFQLLREKIVADHKEGIKLKYQNATGEQPSDEMVEKMVSEGGLVGVFDKSEMVEENQQRHQAVKDIQRSLVELHQVFLDMAVMVETQGEQMNNIEENVVNADAYIKGGTKELDQAYRLKKSRRTWACWIGIVVLVFLLVCLIAILF